MKAVEAVQFAAKGVGNVFSGGRDLNLMLSNLNFSIIQVEAYFEEKEITEILPELMCTWAHHLIGEGREMHARLGAKLEGMVG